MRVYRIPYPPEYDQRILTALVDSTAAGRWCPSGNEIWRHLCSPREALEGFDWQGVREAFVRRIYPNWKVVCPFPLRDVDVNYFRSLEATRRDRKARGPPAKRTKRVLSKHDSGTSASHSRNLEHEVDQQSDDYAKYLRERQDTAFCTLQRELCSYSNENDETLALWRDYMNNRHNEEYDYVIRPQECHDNGFEDSEMEKMMTNVAERLETQEHGAT